MNAHSLTADHLLPEAVQGQVTAFLTPPPPLWGEGVFSASSSKYDVGGSMRLGWGWPSLSWHPKLFDLWGRHLPMAVLAAVLGLTLAAPQAEAAEPPEKARPPVSIQEAVTVPLERVVEVRLDPGLAAMRGSRKKGVEAVQGSPEAAVGGIVLPAQSAYATLPDESAPSRKSRKEQNRPGPGLELADDVFGDVHLKGLICDWLVPRMVDKLVQELMAGSQEG